MDVFLIKDGIVENIAAVKSMQQAEQLYPDYALIERTPEMPLINPGDIAP